MTAAQQQDPFAHLQGALGDEASINQRLDWADKFCFLVSPSTTCALRPGCSVAFNMVRINPETEAHDVGGGRYSLSNAALRKLAGAAGIVFDPDRNCRVAPFEHPYVVNWHAVAAWRGLDGDVLSVPGDYCLDLRDGAAAAQKVLENIKTDDSRGNKLAPAVVAEKGRVQLRDIRAKISERAQTGAELRAIRKALHIRAYTKAELQTKPFVIARLVYDGHDENPEIELENKRAIRGQMLAGARALFGGAPPPRELVAPSIVKALPAHSYDDTFDGEIVAPSEPELPPASDEPQPPPPAPTPQPTSAAAPTPPMAPPPAPPAPAGRSRRAPPAAIAPPPPPPTATASAATARFGRSKGYPISTMSDGDLDWYAEAVEKSCNDPAKARYRDDNEAHLTDVRAEQKRRGAPPPPNVEGAGQGNDDIPF